jgi:hypothetical protein
LLLVLPDARLLTSGITRVARTGAATTTRKARQMGAFTVTSASQLADYIIPLSVKDAVTLTDWCVKKEINGQPGDGHGYFAIYGPDRDGMACKLALHVTPEYLNGQWMYFVILDDYRPRKDGKADIEFGKSSRKVAGK